MSLPMSAEERYAKIREGVVALALMQTRGPELLDEGFLMEGQQGGEALDHLRDVLHDISEQHGIQAIFCVYCGRLVTGDDGPEEIEEEAHAECAAVQTQEARTHALHRTWKTRDRDCRFQATGEIPQHPRRV